MTSDPTRSTIQRIAVRPAAALSLVTMAAFFGPGCTGKIGASEPGGAADSSGRGGTMMTGAGGSTTGGGAATGGGPGTTVACGPVDPGRVTVHRLNIVEYNNTVHDLLGDTTQPAATFPDDTGGGNFDNNADVLSTSPLLFEKLEAAAETLANTALTAGSASRARIITCDPTERWRRGLCVDSC